MSVDSLLFKSKVPSSKKNYVGIEIEFLMIEKNHDKLVKELTNANLQWNVTLGMDASVRDEEFVPQYREVVRQGWNGPWTDRIITNVALRKNGYEIRILGEEKAIPELVDKVCSILDKFDCTVNNTCGLHVHLDMRNRNHEIVYNNLYKHQTIMFNMQPEYRRNNKYCKKLTRLMKPKVGSRYYSINRLAYEEHRTLEVRLHEGTLNKKDIKMWTYFLIQIANIQKKLTRNVLSVETCKFSDKVKEYMNARISTNASKKIRKANTA